MSVADNFGLQLAKYTNVAAAAILIYDYFVTLHSEVKKMLAHALVLIFLVGSVGLWTEVGDHSHCIHGLAICAFRWCTHDFIFRCQDMGHARLCAI